MKHGCPSRNQLHAYDFWHKAFWNIFFSTKTKHMNLRWQTFNKIHYCDCSNLNHPPKYTDRLQLRTDRPAYTQNLLSFQILKLKKSWKYFISMKIIPYSLSMYWLNKLPFSLFGRGKLMIGINFYFSTPTCIWRRPSDDNLSCKCFRFYISFIHDIKGGGVTKLIRIVLKHV
jgi:hypothetical protein